MVRKRKEEYTVRPRDRTSSFPRVFPSSVQAKMSCVFLVLLPMLTVLGMSAFWVYKARQDWETAAVTRDEFQHHTVQLGSLILHLDQERDALAMYLTGRTEDNQMFWKERLDMKRKITDDDIYNLRIGAGNTAIGHSYRSPEMLSHVINRHRDTVKITGEFMDDLQFYTDIISDITAGVGLNSPHLTQGDLWKWMTAYHQLMVAVNYLGAEQSLCSVLYSIICFSHRETFYYANLTYSAESTFSDYLHIYPGDRGVDWKNKDRTRFLPKLTMCRREVFSDLYYQGMSINPMKCDYSRRNETHFIEASQIIIKENHTIVSYISQSLTTAIKETHNTYMLYLVISGAIGCYFILIHLLRCSCIKCIQRNTVHKLSLDDDTCREPLKPKEESENHVTFTDPIRNDHVIRNNSHHRVMVTHHKTLSYRELIPIKVATV